MLTNQDRRAILEQVKTSDSGDIIAALRGQVSTEPMQNPAPTQEPINIPQSPQPVDVDLETTPALPSNLVDSTAALPTQLAKTGGVKSRDGSTYVVNKKAVITDPVRNTEYFSKTPMYEGQPHSTHLMSDDNNLTAWPSIFQDEEGNWFKGNAKEAKKRGELYKFDDKEEMIDFAREGNWKTKSNTKKSHGGVHEEEESFEDSKLGKFLNIKGLKRDGEYIMNTVGAHFGYENTVEDARKMLFDGAASINPIPDFINAADHAQQGKYTDAALYAGFAGLPFAAGPLVSGAKQVLPRLPIVRGARQLMQKAKGKLVNTVKNKLLKTRTPIGNTDMVLETDSKFAKFFESPLKAGESKLVAQVKNKYGPASKGGTNEFINLSYNKSKTPNGPDFYSFDEMFFDKMRTAGQSVKATEKIIPKYSFIGNKPGASSLSTNSLDLTLNRLKNKSKYVDATNYSGDYIQLNKYAKGKINTGKPTNLALNKFNVFTDDEFNALQKTYFGKFGKLNSKNLLNTRGADQYRGFSKSNKLTIKGLNEDTYYLGLPNMMIQKVHKKGGFLNAITNPIRKNIAENLEPYGYDNPVKRVFNAAIGKKDSDRLDSENDGMWWADTPKLEAETERMDLLNMTMGQPQKYNSIEKAIYKPTKSKDPDAEYYRSVVTENTIKKLIKDKKLDLNKQKDGYTYAGRVLGKYKIHKGEDEKGKYYSYYDKWDLNPLDHKYENKKINKLVDNLTKAAGVTPPEIYGRIYLNDLEPEQTIGAKINEEKIKEYRKDIKKQQQQFLEEYGYEAPKGFFSTNTNWDEKKHGGFKKKKKIGGLKESKEKTINYRQHMMNYLHTSGRDTNMVNTVMNAIAQHESLNVADQKQISQRDDGTFYDGPGRGAYQFEMSDKGAASTALNRNYRFNLFNTDKELKDFPKINEFAKEKNPDFSTISRADQDGLFIGDKIFGGPPRRNMFDLVTRNRTTPPNQEEVFQYWLKNHKGKISVVRDGKNTTVDINKATKKEIAGERKKWNRTTKKLFKTGGYKSRYV